LPTQSNTRRFSDIRLGDIALVGGTAASLGEFYWALSEQGVRVPNGFALTAQTIDHA
jgi:pyruvate,water dikinase